MSLIPMLFSDWWEDLDRPHRLWDQYFGNPIDPDDLSDVEPFNSELLAYRPHRRNRRRYHPFSKIIGRKGRGTSTVQADKDKFQVTLDVAQFRPEEITVKVVDKNVVVEAKHEEKEDEHGWISRQFMRKYLVPSQCDIDQVESHLSSDGILNIMAPRKEPLKGESHEKTIKIQYTGKPALKDHEAGNCNDSIELVKDQHHQQRATYQQQSQQQAQQQSQQQQHAQFQQRARKGTVKTP